MEETFHQNGLTVKVVVVILTYKDQNKVCKSIVMLCVYIIYDILVLSPQSVLMQQRGGLSNGLSLPRVSALKFKQTFVLVLLRL